VAFAALGRGTQLVAAQDGSDITVTMVTDTAGLGDQNFNDITYKGGQDAVTQFGITFNAIESATEADYEPNITSAAESSDLVVATGFYLTDSVAAVAPQFPDTDFLLIDAVAEGDNVDSVLFKENEGGFLAGILAGLFTKTNTIGVVGGQRIPPVLRYEVGFVAGIKSVNPDAEIIISYADTFGDPALGKELALAQYNKNADISFPIAGSTGIGVFDAAKEKGLGFWVIAADADQAHLGPEYQLGAALKKIDVAVLGAVEAVVNDTFEAGTHNLGINENGVDLLVTSDEVTADTLGIIAKYKAAIADGTVVAPATDEELAAFVPTAAADLPEVASPEASPAS
jgi:basic membrane protein A